MYSEIRANVFHAFNPIALKKAKTLLPFGLF